MTETPSKPFRTVKCENCGNRSKRVVDVTIGAWTGEVGRCTMCDARKCAECEGRTFDLFAPTCKHCRAGLMEAPK